MSGKLRSKLMGIVSLWLLLIPNLYAQGDLVYINSGGSAVSAFSFGADRILSEVPGSPFITGGGAGTFQNGIATSALRHCLYASNNVGARVSAFSIDPITGVLSSIPGSPFDTGTGILGGVLLAISPNEQFLFALNGSTGNLATFRIAFEGSLIRLPLVPPVSGLGKQMRVSPDGRFLFVLEGFSGVTIGVFSIGTDGELARISQTHFTPASDCDNGALDLNCAGNLLFAASECGDFFVFNVDRNGTLTPIPGSPFIANIGVTALSSNSPGSLLFTISNGDKRIRVFGVDQAGTVSPVPVSSVDITNPSDEDTTPVDLAINKDENILYVNSADGTVFVFAVSPSGVLSPVQGSPFPAGPSFGATITAFPGRSCGPAFDLCIQDDSNTNILQLNSTTGDYRVANCKGVIAAGTGKLTKKGCLITLQHYASDRRVLANIDTCQNKATATIQLLSPGTTLTIADRNIRNNSCVCR